MGHLDREARSGVGFEHDGAHLGVDNKINADVTHLQCVGEFHGGSQQVVPAGNHQPGDLLAGVRMSGDSAAGTDAAEGAAGDEVNGSGGGSLVQVGAALGFECWQPDHGHHRYVAIENDADIGSSANGDGMHGRVHDDPLLDDAQIDLPAERVQTREDGRKMIIELAFADEAAAGRFVIVSVAAGDDDDSAAGRARSGFHNELVSVADELGEPPQVAVAADDRIRFWDGDAVLMANLLGNGFVVDAGVERGGCSPG